MPFYIVRNDITKMEVDAIVNAANTSLLGGGGVDGAIHRAAGPQLLEACKALHGCEVGEAKLTPAFRLPCKYVIHTVGPEWMGGAHGEAQLLRSCYTNALRIAAQQGFTSVAFPLISAGAYGYPKAEALRIAADSISAFVLQQDMAVYLTVFDTESFALGSKLFADIRQYIDENYVSEAEQRYGRRRSAAAGSALKDTLIGMLPKRTELPEQKIHRAEKASAPAPHWAEDVDLLL
ncbi:MAG: O-acetyl-ADP-ribose deacetylase, partial [Oscillospiraceae bacterium]|nr:O-acetyl-ADP-ribose deacetylase [Oscillospiraceae bacterium]